MSTVRAKSSFQAVINRGKPNAQAVPVADGELFDSNHPVVKGREHLFVPVEDYVLDPGRRKTSRTRDEKSSPSEVLMERTSADPGEKRSVDTKTGVGEEKKDEEKPKASPASGSRSTARAARKDGEV